VTKRSQDGIKWLFVPMVEKVYSTYARGAKQYGKKSTAERQKCFKIKMWVVD